MQSQIASGGGPSTEKDSCCIEDLVGFTMTWSLAPMVCQSKDSEWHDSNQGRPINDQFSLCSGSFEFKVLPFQYSSIEAVETNYEDERSNHGSLATNISSFFSNLISLGWPAKWG